MIVERVNLYEHFGLSRKEGYVGYLQSYVIDKSSCTRPALLIIAGGGYSHVSEREGEPVALKYIESGFNCFVLEYSTAPACHPMQLMEAIMAMIYIREKAQKFSLNVEKVATLGFSAGAHLCAMIATISREEIVGLGFEESIDCIRPNAVVLGYPVVSGFCSPHVGSFLDISGGDEELYSNYLLRNV